MDITGGPRAKARDTILYGGLAIGILDFLDASLFFPAYYGITFQHVWWGPASGIVGREAARSGGWNTAILGIVMHFCVAFSIAVVYFLLTRLVPKMLTHPIVSGLAFGIAAHFVMQCVVVPLSARGGSPANVFSEPLGSMVNSLIGHALLVGLPVALLASWSAKRKN